MMETIPETAEPNPAEAMAAAATPLASALPGEPLQEFAGVLTPARFSAPEQELLALHTGAGVYDLGWRARLRITGEDRVRWLNGMVTNTVRDLQPGCLAYTFLLNAQGRIQGDGDIYALPDALLLATDQAQLGRLQAHLDRFIIMDDVELAPELAITGVGIAGPGSQSVLATLGLLPDAPVAAPALGEFVQHGSMLLAQEQPGQYVLWISEAAALPTWTHLVAAGATPCGIEAVEALRVLLGTPRYGADIHEKSLAQETGQTRALNFNKGCYLGQEIVERIRSRATVHRAIRSFQLEGDTPLPGAVLTAPGTDPAKAPAPAGELTSITTISLPGLPGSHALGTIRTEAAGAVLSYSGGRATALAQAPLHIARKDI